MNIIKQNSLSEAVLFHLFMLSQIGNGRTKVDKLSDQFDIAVGGKRMELALEALEARKLIYNSRDGFYTIERKGYSYVEEQLEIDQTIINEYSKFGDHWLERQTLGIGDIPASNRIVTRSDNQKEMEEIDNEVSLIQQELNENNEVGDDLGEDKSLIKVELEAAQVITKHNRFRVSSILNLILPALRYLADKFGSAAIGESAKRLIALLLGLI